jgi:hypothetical protein
MARHTISGRSTVAPTSARAAASLFAIAGVEPKIVEIGVFNTTTTECVIAVQRFTNATGVGTGLTEAEADPSGAPPQATGFAGHTGDGGVGDEIKRVMLGAVRGAGMVWTWPESSPLRIPAGTANGVGLTCPTGTGQIIDFYIEWIE